MDAITLWQPYASLIAAGAKPYETRHWPPPRSLIGKRIAIHAAARKPTRVELDHLYGDVSDSLGFCQWHLRIPYGAVVCTATLAGAYRCGSESMGRSTWTEVVPGSAPIYINGQPTMQIKVDKFGDYSPGRWAWALTEIEAFNEPIPAKGSQGWWQWATTG